jgi:hypothetical protein
MEETKIETNAPFTSSIIPPGSRLEPIRAKDHVWAPIIGIEVVHVICFFVLVAFIFISLWKEAKK